MRPRLGCRSICPGMIKDISSGRWGASGSRIWIMNHRETTVRGKHSWNPRLAGIAKRVASSVDRISTILTICQGDYPQRWNHVYTQINEYLRPAKEGPAETPTALSGRGQCKSRQLEPFYDVWRSLGFRRAFIVHSRRWPG